MQIIRDIWLCQDCMPVAVNGDYSHLDYAYGEPEASQVMCSIDAGLATLPGLVPDFTDEPQRECCDCGFIHYDTEEHFPTSVENEGTDDEESFRECKECHSYDTRERDSGELEFSRIECDCCGNDLAGSRFRFAQLIHEGEKA